LRALRHGRAPRQAGHDPLGLWMVWLLWTLVVLLGLAVWISRFDAF
jgi:cytochrome b